MANKQIKDFGAITDGTGTSILVQNNTTDTYNKISAENIAAAATTLSKAITAQENVTIQKQLILDIDGNFDPDPPSIVKSTGVDYNVSMDDYGLIDFNFTDDTNTENVWGIKIRKGPDAWGIKSDGIIHGHHLMLDYGMNVSCIVPAIKYISPNGNNWGNSDTGVFEADLTADFNTSNLFGVKIINGSDTWGIKANGDGIFENFEANSLNSNHLNLVDHNVTTTPSSSIELGNHGGSYNPASIEIKNSDGATSFLIPPNLLEEKYTSMAAAAAGGVPIGGAFIMVDSLTNVTTSYLSVRLI